jgi:methionyl-tRNA formyltransferase
MGTPGFALATLEALVAGAYNVVAVVTAPDKPAGRGQQLKASEVKMYAERSHIPVLQPTNLKAESFLQELAIYKADLQVVVAFRMLPQVVWNMPSLGTYNVHASLLPQYRGAAPINWAVINGETQTGVTIFKLVHDIDKGNILLQKKVDIKESDNVGIVHDKLMTLGAAAMVEAIDLICQGKATEVPQIESADLKHAPKLFTEQCTISWTESALSIHNQIRGLSPYPGAITQLQGKTFKIYESKIVPNTDKLAPGMHCTDGKTYLHFTSADDCIACTSVQIEGKKRLPIEDFLRGYKA